MNIVEIIRSETRDRVAKPALIEKDRTLSYADLLAAVDQTAEALKTAGIHPGQRVAFLCEDSVDYIIGSLAVLALPAVVVPISPSLMEHEVDAILDRIDVHGLLFDRSIRSRPGARDVAGAGFKYRLLCGDVHARSPRGGGRIGPTNTGQRHPRRR